MPSKDAKAWNLVALCRGDIASNNGNCLTILIHQYTCDPQSENPTQNYSQTIHLSTTLWEFRKQGTTLVEKITQTEYHMQNSTNGTSNPNPTKMLPTLTWIQNTLELITGQQPWCQVTSAILSKTYVIPTMLLKDLVEVGRVVQRLEQPLYGSKMTWGNLTSSNCRTCTMSKEYASNSSHHNIGPKTSTNKESNTPKRLPPHVKSNFTGNTTPRWSHWIQ